MIQYASALMLIQGVINKFGAVFIIIPEPIVGGMFCIMFGMICAFGNMILSTFTHSKHFFVRRVTEIGFKFDASRVMMAVNLRVFVFLYCYHITAGLFLFYFPIKTHFVLNSDVMS